MTAADPVVSHVTALLDSVASLGAQTSESVYKRFVQGKVIRNQKLNKIRQDWCLNMYVSSTCQSQDLAGNSQVSVTQ